MKWSTPLLLVAILAVAGFAFRSIFLGTPETPWEVCTRLERITKLPSLDKRSALRSLSLSLKHPTARGDDELTRRLLRLRADIHLDMSAYDKARSDVERMQALLPEEDVVLELEAIQLQARTGKTTEALRRVTTLSERHPDASSIPILKGRLEAERAQDWNQLARELTSEYLVRTEAEQAFPIIDHLCAQHSEDPRRTRLLRELHNYFSDTKAEQLRRVLDHCDRASKHYTAARSSYAQGLEREMTIPGLAALLDLLVKCGRSDLVVDLGVASRVFPEIMSSPGNLIALIDAMELLGQEQRIGRIVSEWPWTDSAAPQQFYARTSRVLYNADLLGPLASSSQALRSFGAKDVISAYFYAGYIGGRTSSHQHALRMLNRFLQANSPGPVPGARSTAYRYVAAAWAAQNQPQKALRSLQGVLDSKGILVADDYLKLAEAQRASATSLPILPEKNWTQGMALAPERTAELLPKWKELGEQSFKTFGQDFDRFYASMLRQKRSRPRQKVGPYTLYRIGLRHLEDKRPNSALSIAKLLVKRYPNLLPAIDLEINALLMAKNTSHLGPGMVMKRLRLVGADSDSRSFLSRYPIGRFSKEEQLELVRLDPHGTGRTQVAKWLFDQGHYERLLLVLRPVPDVVDPLSLQVLRIKALFATGKYDQTIEEAKPLLSNRAIGQTCQQLTIQARLATGDNAGVMQDLRTLLSKGPRKPADRRRLAKDLIDQGLLEGASAILGQLDKSRGLRTPSVIEWRALCAAANGKTQQAEEFLSRALPFFDDGRIELLQVILSAGNRDWPNLPLHIQALNASKFRASPFQAAGIAILGENLQEGLDMARRGVDQNPGSMAWALLHAAALSLKNEPSSFDPQLGRRAAEQARVLLTGSGDARKDPRDTIAMLLALDMAPWQTWAERRAITLASQGPPNLWLGWMVAEARFRSGRIDQARQDFSALTVDFPQCAPLWDHVFAVLTALHPEDLLHPDVMGAHADQALAVPLREFLTPRQIALGLAGQAVTQGHPDQAISTLERYLGIVDKRMEPEVRWMLARLLAENGDFSQAMEHFGIVLRRSKIRGLNPWIPEYLDWVDKAANGTAQSGPALTPTEIADHLESLAHRYPSDPHLSLKRLQYRVLADDRSAILAADEALAALEMLRSLAPGRSIDNLRPNSEHAWMQYMLSISPVLGEEYCREALDLSPGNLDMWMGLTHALQAQGRIAETRELCEDLIQVSDDPELHYRYASLLALRGAPAKTVHAHLIQADKLAGTSGPSARNRLTRAQTTLLHGKGNLNQVLRDLEQLWRDREEFALQVPPLELGRVYLTALVLRHEEDDLAKLDSVTEAMLTYVDQDPYSEDIVRSFRAVGHSIEARLLVKDSK